MKDLGKLSSALKPALNAYSTLTEENQFKVRFLLKNFNRFYAYMAQIVRTFDKELYKTYVFTEFLYKFLPKNPHEKVNLDDKIALKYNQLKETFSGSIELNPSTKDKTIKGEVVMIVKERESNKNVNDED